METKILKQIAKENKINLKDYDMVLCSVDVSKTNALIGFAWVDGNGYKNFTKEIRIKIEPSEAGRWVTSGAEYIRDILRAK